MTIKKIALLEDVIPDVVATDKIKSSEAVQERFNSVIANLKSVKVKEGKKLVPKTDDFLFASCIMMHAAEASLIDQETGEPLKNAKGEAVVGGFKKITDHRGRESVIWESADGVKPYKNGNGDIFPEEDLLKAYKEWVGKPLCRDHVSDSIDGVRGVIVDTYYDPKYKRVHALFALDRVNYADLARKIEAGYATSVSMGTAVGRSICTDCGNVATVEAEYCSHVKLRSCYGEVNKELSPIELSIVVTGADPKAKIKTVLAHLKDYETKVKKLAESGEVDKATSDSIEHTIEGIRDDVKNMATASKVDVNERAAVLVELMRFVDAEDSSFDETRLLLQEFLKDESSNFDELSDELLKELLGNLKNLGLEEEKNLLFKHLLSRSVGQIKGDGADVQVGMEEVRPDLVDSEGDSLRSEVDLMDQKQWRGEPGDLFFEPGVPQQFSSLYTNNLEKTTNLNKINEITKKIAALKEQLSSLQIDTNKEIPMTFSDLKKRAQERKAYFQGTEDPAQALPYERMGDDHKIRENEDKQMVGDELDTSADNPDMEQKKMLQRAELEQRMAARAKLLKKVKEAEMMEVKNPQTGETKVVEKKPDGSVSEYVAAVNDGKKKKDKDHKADDKKHSKDHKKAYMQGTEDPRDALPYELMGDQEGLRANEDRQMKQTDSLGGDDGLVPGDAELKKSLQRIASKKLSARFYKSANPSDSRWDFFAGTGEDAEKVFSVTAKQAYGEHLSKKVAENLTFSDFFHSKPYGSKVMKLVRAEGPLGAANEMGIDMDMPEAELGSNMDDDMQDVDELTELRNAVSAGVDKIEVGLEEIKSAVVEEPASEGLADLDVDLEGMGDEMPAPDAGLPTMASVSDKDMLEAYAFLSDIAGELAYLDARLASTKAGDKLVSVAKQALTDASKALEESAKMTASYKSAKLSKKADQHDADCDDPVAVIKLDPMADDGMNAEDYNREKEEMYALTEEDKDEIEDLVEEEVEEELEEHEDEMHADDGKDKDKDKDEDEDKKDSDKDDKDAEKKMEMLEELGDKLDEVHEDVKELDKDHADLEKKLSSRRERRRQLIAKAAQYDDVYLAERSQGGPTTLDGQPDSKVETLHEVHDVMKDVATKDQDGPKVREAAEKLAAAIKRGAINADKLDELVAVGAVDAETANYYKTFYGQVDGGSDFADGLVKEFSKQASEDGDDKIVRYKRAYTLGIEGQKKGVVGPTNAALNDFVDNIVNVPDHVFASIKNIVEQTKSNKTSVAAPQVGLTNDEGNFNVTANQKDELTPTFENLSKAFLK